MKSVGDGIKANNAHWNFQGKTVDNFENHIKKSVPFYEEGHELIVQISDYFIKNDSICYELGCAVGKLSYKLSCRHKNKNALFIGIDIEKDMIAKAKKSYQNPNLKFIQHDINTINFKSADMFVAYYTIQFIHPKFRQELINNIYKNLNWGGCFIMYEKVRANDARFQDIFTGLYTEFKLSNGYTPDEILSKTRSLKGVLEPFSSNANIDMLKRAGFVDIISIQKYINFEGFLAIK